MEEGVHVLEIGIEDGEAVGVVRWDAVPELRFRLMVTADGRVPQLVVTAPRDGTVSARQLRKAPIATMQRVIRRQVAIDAERHRDELGTLDRRRRGPRPHRPDIQLAVEQERAWLTSRAAAFDDFTRRPGRAGRSPLEYARVAARYEALALSHATARAPIAALADDLSVSPSTARNLVAQCRDRGLLTRPGQGSAGGALTERAKRLLNGEEE